MLKPTTLVSFGTKIRVVEPGEVNYFVEVSQNHLATYQSAHGGFLAVFDQIVGTAALAAMSDHKLVSTVEFKINYLKPAYLNDKLKEWENAHHGKNYIP